jgi:hypothetical protein
METVQELLPWSLALTREIRLQELTVTSTTRLSNTGSGTLPFRWFAHPFFPLLRNGHCCRFSPPFPIAENPGFALNSRGIVSMKSTHRWQDGHFQEIEEARGHTLGALQYHPLIPGIEVKGDFPLHRLALWANDKTFSFEPFCAGSLNPGETTVWSIQYRFGHREA